MQTVVNLDYLLWSRVKAPRYIFYNIYTYPILKYFLCLSGVQRRNHTLL